MGEEVKETLSEAPNQALELEAAAIAGMLSMVRQTPTRNEETTNSVLADAVGACDIFKMNAPMNQMKKTVTDTGYERTNA